MNIISLLHKAVPIKYIIPISFSFGEGVRQLADGRGLRG